MIKRIWKWQMADRSNVRVRVLWDHTKRKYIVDSEAGRLIFKPRNLFEMTKFRDKFINPLTLAGTKKQRGEDTSKEIFKLYLYARRNYSVSYRANLRTRLRSVMVASASNRIDP